MVNTSIHLSLSVLLIWKHHLRHIPRDVANIIAHMVFDSRASTVWERLSEAALVAEDSAAADGIADVIYGHLHRQCGLQ